MHRSALSTLSALLFASLCLVQPTRAAIDIGHSGNGELFFNLWDCTRSYSRDLDISIDAFEARLAEAGPVALSWPADGVLAKFLAGVLDARELRWNVVAVDTKGARRVLSTYTPPRTDLPLDADTGRRLTGTVQARINEINLGLNGTGDYRNPADDAQSAIFRACQVGFTGNDSTFGRRLSDKLHFDSSGTVDNAMADTGLGFMRLDIAPGGLTPAGLHEYADEGAPLKVWLDGEHGLHIGVPSTAERGER